MRSTFKTVFYVNGSKEKNGIVPIMDGLQSTGLLRSSVANRAFQRNFGMPKATGRKARAERRWR